MADEHGDPYGRARDAQVRQAQDLAILGDDLPFLLRVAVREEDVDLGQGVEGDRVRVDRRDLGLARDVGTDLALHLGDRVGPGARHGLVGIHDDPLQAHAVAQRHQDRCELHRGAVRVGDDPLVAFQVVRIDLGHDERDVRLHPPGGRVVDDRGAASRCGRCQIARDVRAGTEQGDIDAIEGLGDRFGDLDRLATDRHAPSGRSAGREQPQLPHREVAFTEDLDHRPTDDAGGADDRDGEWFAVHPGHGSARSVASPGTAGVYQRLRPDPPRRSGYGRAAGVPTALRELRVKRPGRGTPMRGPWPGGAASRPCATG